MAGPSPPRAEARVAALVGSPPVAGAVVFVLAVAAALLRPEGSGVAAWWPAAGVGVAAVVCTTGRRRGAVLLAVTVATLAGNLAAGRSLLLSLCFTAGNVAEAALAARILARDGRPELGTLPQLGRLFCAAAAGAVLAATGAALAVAGLTVADPWASWSAVATAHGAAIVVLVPAVMRVPRRPATARRVETVALWTLVIGVSAVVFAPGQTLPLAYLAVAALVGTGLRLGVRAASAQLVAVAVLAAVLGGRGGGPFAQAGRELTPVVAGTLLQLFIGSCALVVLALAISVAQRESALARLAEQRRFDRAVLEVVNAGVLACDAQGRVVVRNRAHRLATGVGDGVEVDADRLALDLRVTEDGVPVPADRTPLRRALRGEELTDLSLRIEPDGGPPTEVVAMARPILDDDGRLLGAVAAFADVTAERAVQVRLRESLAFREAVLAVSPDTLFIFDPVDRETVWLSRPASRRPGQSPPELVAMGSDHCRDRVHPDDATRMIDADEAARALPDGAVRKVRLRIRDADGRYRWVSRRVTPFARDASGAVTRLLGVVRDITENVELEERLAAEALHDPLTGLPNRRLLTDRLATALHRTARTTGLVPVLYCDLDGFKVVNDTAGHAVGDAVLCATATRLTTVLRPQDTVARVGGDEFVAVLDPALRAVDHGGGDGAAEVRSQARAIARRIITALAEPVVVDGVEHRVTVSIGMTFARSGDSPEQALSDADRAMYEAKLRGKGRHEVYDGAAGQA
ncbi:diguanylate cyclase domain-containing protein [Pseudonocardia abyssalis]|uniref:Diguanylate cyclase n=1 Tax=Pseudonocardia abyssalis TaxID=2792008 RepID=A0ABS6UMA6_9PSEU|nr:diguanylate cyclase [Pseudonocardia abyssalis]MBW0115913.1 diguanylate cyclase [Pseudonocardia abyssalis]MBW0133380.1 diguanylate cyclase [Pseudonocardia abyssalis]